MPIEKKPWWERLAGERTGDSKHQRGKSRPCGWRRKMRVARKRQKAARRAQRGK